MYYSCRYVLRGEMMDTNEVFDMVFAMKNLIIENVILFARNAN